MTKKNQDVGKMINVGNRKEPSKQALDRFMQIYMEIATRGLNEKEYKDE